MSGGESLVLEDGSGVGSSSEISGGEVGSYV